MINGYLLHFLCGLMPPTYSYTAQMAYRIRGWTSPLDAKETCAAIGSRRARGAVAMPGQRFVDFGLVATRSVAGPIVQEYG
jgi:hypothetical protein